MPLPSQAKADVVQVCVRLSRETADVLNDLASRHVNGLRGLILEWLGQAGYESVAQRDLARPDGRRRLPLTPTAAS
jgi:hypothetical protein